MLPKKIISERLSFIKYLYEQAVSQSNLPEPLCWTSILMLHDTVELFNQLAVEHKDIKVPEKNPFMKYWEQLPSLSHKETMSRLNHARVSLKHHGLFPSKLDLETFRGDILYFLRDHTQSYFSQDFDQLTLTNIIDDTEIRGLLKEAEAFLANKEFDQSVGKIASAFNKITRSYEASKLDRFRRSPFDLTKSLESASLYHSGVNYYDPTEGKLGDFIHATEECFQDLQEAIKIIGFGINYRQYIRFKMITPALWFTMDGTCHLDYQRIILPLKREDVLFGIQFCIESYLRLSEFDFQIDPTLFLIEDGKHVIISIINSIKTNKGIHIDSCNWEQTKNVSGAGEHILVVQQCDKIHKLEFSEEELKKGTDSSVWIAKLKKKLESFINNNFVKTGNADPK